MANNPLIRLKFLTTANPPWTTGDEARVYWDDVANAIVVAKNGTLLADPSYNINLGLSIQYDTSGIPTTNYIGFYLLTDGTDGDPIDLPVGSAPVFVPPPPDPAIPPPPVVVKQPGGDITLPPVVTPVQPTPTPTPAPTPVTTGGGKVLNGNGVDSISYPTEAPTNFIP